MQPRYLLDSNICIYALSGRHPGVVRHIDQLRPGVAALSVVVHGELMVGIVKSRRAQDALQRLAALLRIAPVVDLPAAAGERYGTIRAALERTGTSIGANDLWIAAHALAADFTLVTNNEREFQRVPGLRIENWAAS